ncbi:MAG TPA: YMGG-like glycine zipper-containing protein, partial [Rhizomicrobium sp.]|nr:YMGG-like glycine zipper-containing protein [Rhizomicrobium sp.]
MMIRSRTVVAIVATSAAAALLAGCVTQPMGPTIPVMPGPSKSLEAFQADENVCEQYASQRVAGQTEAANNTAIGQALLGTALGAGLGAAVGGGRGAAIGAASGAVVGTAVGANTSGWAQMSVQQRYDVSYAQCMETKGNKVPGPRHPRRYPPP